VLHIEVHFTVVGPPEYTSQKFVQGLDNIFLHSYHRRMTEKEIEALRQLARNLSTDVAVARGEAHAAFDPLWKSGKFTRTAAYKWLATQMGVRTEDCHMEMFNVAQCRKVVEICRD